MTDKIKLGRNDKCACGSTEKYKNCCDSSPINGPLVRKLGSDFVDLQRINLFEINNLLQILCIDSEKFSSFHANVMDLFSGSKKATEAIRDHTYNLKKDIGAHKNENTWIVDDFDQELSFYIKDIFIRGKIIINDLCGVANELGFSVSFLFQNEENNKFNTKIKKLTEKFRDQAEAEKLVAFILREKKLWLEDFVKARDQIEHGVFNIEDTQYFINNKEKLVPRYPLILGKNINNFFSFYTQNVFTFSRELLIFLIAEKLSGVSLPEGMALKVALVDEPSFKMKMYKAVVVDSKSNQIISTNFNASCPQKVPKSIKHDNGKRKLEN